VSTEPKPLRILFSMRHLGSFRMYESVIRELADRGHHVHLVIDRKEKLGWQKGLEQILADYPTVSWKWAVRQRHVQHWFEFSRLVRVWLDYLRYFGPLYETAPILRQRAANLLPPVLVRITHRWPANTSIGRTLLRWLLRAAERALPRVHEIDELMRAERPDVMLITPLVYLGSPQVEMLRSAKAIGVRTALCVGSWDHLSSKAVIRDVPHRVLVWNETQRDEAVDLHGIAAEQVVVTGAQCYDRWFGRAPSRSREAFCRAVGLAPDRPFLLYVCSALFWGSPVEAEFIVRWVDALRSSPHESLRSIGILIRPHPARHDEWRSIDLARFENVTLYGSSPIDHDSRNDYFDSLYHASAVVGLNTSAFLEAAIVGRPVHTILLPEFQENQEGTLHFRYLQTVGGGLLRGARSFDEHRQLLLDSLEQGVDNSRFVAAFIRPDGLDVPATTVFVDAVERLAREPAPAPVRERMRDRILRVILWPLASSARFMFHDVDAAQAPASAGAMGQLREVLRARRDRTTREVAKKRRWQQKADLVAERRRLEEAAERERERARQQRQIEKHSERTAIREAAIRARDERHAKDRQQKEARLAQRRREKSKHAWRKWRQQWQQRIRARLGLA
jgi:hypothetical protein